MTQRVEWPRIERVLGKWIRGLFWKQHGERLPADLRVQAGYLPFRDEDVLHGASGWPGTFEFTHEIRGEGHRMRWTFCLWDRFGLVAATNENLTVQTAEMFDDEFPGHLIEYVPAEYGVATSRRHGSDVQST